MFGKFEPKPKLTIIIMTNKRSIFILLFLSSLLSFSQEGIPIYSDYLSDNLYLLNPSMAGISYKTQIRITARQQWFDQRNAPNLQTLNFSSRISNRSGIGVIAYNDRNGFHSETGAYLTYAHHIPLTSFDSNLNQFSFGLSVGLTQSRLDERNFDLNDFDPIIAGIMQSHAYYNVDLGVAYNLSDLSVHFSVKNMLFQNRSIYTEKYESKNQRKYIFGAGYAFGDLMEDWSFEPSMLFQITERTGEAAVDLNVRVFKEMNFGRIWGGLSYRQSFDGSEYINGEKVNVQKLSWLTPIFGVNLHDFMFAYTYSYQTGNAKFDSGGFHQITIGYSFNSEFRKRFNCNCPNIN